MGSRPLICWSSYYRYVSVTCTSTGVSSHDLTSGTRLGITDHAEDNAKVFGFSLTSQDKKDIEELLKESNGHRLIRTIGDCGAEYRGSRV